MERIVEIKSLNFSYNGIKILEDVELIINKGDFLAIVGPNGGGKSTLVRCILGLLKPQSGEIILFSKPSSNFTEWYKIGYVPQRNKDFHLKFNPIIVKEFIELPSKLYRKNIPSKRLLQLSELFGLSSLLNKRVSQLSFGQIQRAQIVQSLVLEPEILFLDEPTVGLDFMSQKAFYELLSQFNREGLTIVIITHETWLLHKGITKVACLNRKLYYHGKHEEFCFLSSDHHQLSHEHW